ncbi:MAG: porin family protein [Chitinophagaceae bacterium]
MKYTLTFFGILVVTLLHAQTIVPGWHFGIKADLNFSTISGKGMTSGYTIGGQGGAYAEYIINKDWSVQPEILFTQNNTKKGADFLTYYNTDGNPFAATDIKLAYVSLPVLLKYNINKSFSILAGPQYGLLLVDAESLLSRGDGKAFKSSEISGNLGAQFNVGRVALYGRYNIGISDINNVDNRYSWRSSHLQLGIAVKIY